MQQPNKPRQPIIQKKPPEETESNTWLWVVIIIIIVVVILIIIFFILRAPPIVTLVGREVLEWIIINDTTSTGNFIARSNYLYVTPSTGIAPSINVFPGTSLPAPLPPGYPSSIPGDFGVGSLFMIYNTSNTAISVNGVPGTSTYGNASGPLPKTLNQGEYGQYIWLTETVFSRIF